MDFKTISKLEYLDYIKNRKNLDKNYSKSVIEKFTQEKPRMDIQEQKTLECRRKCSAKYYEKNKDTLNEKSAIRYQKKKDNRLKQEQEKNKLKSEEEAQKQEIEEEQPIEQPKPRRHPLLDYLIF